MLRIGTILILGAFLGQGAFAQDGLALVTLRRFIDVSLDLSDSVAEQRLQNEKDQATVLEKKGAFAPTVALTGQAISTGGGTSASVNGNQLSTASEQSSINTNATLSYNLLNGFQDIAKLRASEASRDQSRYQLIEERRAQTETALKLFFGIAEDQSDLENEKKEIDYNKKNLGEAKNRVRTGQSRPTEAINLEATIANNEIDLSTTEASLVQNIEGARRLLRTTSDLRVSYGTPRFSPDQIKTLVDKLVTDDRADLKAQKANTVAQRHTFDAAKAVSKPTLDFNSSYVMSDTQAMSQKGQHTLGLTLTVPLPFGIQKSAQIAEARKTVEIAERQQEQKKRDLEQERLQLIRTLSSNINQIAKLKAAITVSRANVKALERDHQNGLGTYTDVLTASSTYQQTIRKYDRALLEFDLNCYRALIWSSDDEEFTRLFGES